MLFPQKFSRGFLTPSLGGKVVVCSITETNWEGDDVAGQAEPL